MRTMVHGQKVVKDLALELEGPVLAGGGSVPDRTGLGEEHTAVIWTGARGTFARVKSNPCKLEY
ncbi:hypothetical protein ACFL45_10805, partial [Candidatus Neomarinimicrobiota bacterium]